MDKSCNEVICVSFDYLFHFITGNMLYYGIIYLLLQQKLIIV